MESFDLIFSNISFFKFFWINSFSKVLPEFIASKTGLVPKTISLLTEPLNVSSTTISKTPNASPEKLPLKEFSSLSQKPPDTFVGTAWTSE